MVVYGNKSVFRQYDPLRNLMTLLIFLQQVKKEKTNKPHNNLGTLNIRVGIEIKNTTTRKSLMDLSKLIQSIKEGNKANNQQAVAATKDSSRAKEATLSSSTDTDDSESDNDDTARATKKSRTESHSAGLQGGLKRNMLLNPRAGLKVYDANAVVSSSVDDKNKNETEDSSSGKVEMGRSNNTLTPLPIFVSQPPARKKFVSGTAGPTTSAAGSSKAHSSGPGSQKLLEALKAGRNAAAQSKISNGNNSNNNPINRTQTVHSVVADLIRKAQPLSLVGTAAVAITEDKNEGIHEALNTNSTKAEDDANEVSINANEGWMRGLETEATEFVDLRSISVGEGNTSKENEGSGTTPSVASASIPPPTGAVSTATAASLATTTPLASTQPVAAVPKAPIVENVENFSWDDL